jgi:predicted nuclease of restriction endonuclease-like (RecB) superfamily
MLVNSKEYLDLIGKIKREIAAAQQSVMLNANKELMLLYWKIGNHINAHRKWGDRFTINMARDIKAEFPNIQGFSERNLRYMAKFADIYKDFEIWQTVSAKLSWSHNVALIDRIKDDNERLWYAKQTIANGWSLNVMHLQIDSQLYERQAIADKTTNFKDRLPAPQSDLAQQILKDPYIFDFVERRRGMVEREVEDELVNHIAKFLLELGKGFAFVGEDLKTVLRAYNTKEATQDKSITAAQVYTAKISGKSVNLYFSEKKLDEISMNFDYDEDAYGAPAPPKSSILVHSLSDHYGGGGSEWVYNKVFRISTYFDGGSGGTFSVAKVDTSYFSFADKSKKLRWGASVSDVKTIFKDIKEFKAEKKYADAGIKVFIRDEDIGGDISIGISYYFFQDQLYSIVRGSEHTTVTSMTSTYCPVLSQKANAALSEKKK